MNTHRKLLAVNLLFLVSGIALAGLFYSISPMSNIRTPAHVSMSSCTYLISQSGGITYAQNCDTGAVLVQSAISETVINDAIAALTLGGKLFIKSGTYTFTTTPVHLPDGDAAAIGSTSVSNIELYGEGNSTILTAGANLNGVIIGAANVEGWDIHDLQVDGNRAKQSASGATPGPGLTGIELYNVLYSKVDRCYVHNNKTYGIYVSGSSDSVTGSYFVSNLSNNVEIDAGPTAGSSFVIQNNIVDGSSDVGISLSGYSSTVYISDVICTDNIIRHANLGIDPWGENSGVGIAVGDTGPARNVTVSENQVYGAKIAVLSGGRSASEPDLDVQISDNQLQSPTDYGIQVILTTSAIIQGNVIDAPGSMGIITDPTDLDISLSGNHISNASQYSIDNAAPYALIEDNHFDGGPNYGTTHSGIYTDAAYTTMIGNIFVGAYLSYVAIQLESGSDHSVVSNNTIYATSNRGCIYVVSTGDTVSGNKVYGSTVGIGVSSTASGTFVVGNDLAGNTYPISGSSTPYSSGPITATGVVIENNAGYNPLGNIAIPFTSSDLIVDSGGTSSTLPNATTITNTQSPKTISILISSPFRADHTFVLKVGGVQWSSVTAPSAQVVPFTFTLQPGENFYCQYETGDITDSVSGQ
ncbi:MAG: right-handed parallel beta-helix repeat-containing protein [Candidatus Bathyarchaeia archaeon]